MSKIDKLLNLLDNGHELTVAEIRRRVGLRSPYHAVRTLRKEGYPIYSNRVRGGRVEYKLGTGHHNTRFNQLRRQGLRDQAVKSLYTRSV
jgi:hypothetical protein